MNTLQQAFINGFVKRAAEYGIDKYSAIELLKQSAPNQIETQPGGKTYKEVANNPERPVAAEPPPGVSALSLKDHKKLRIPVPSGGTVK